MNKFIKIAAPLSLLLVSLCSCGSSKKVEIDLDNYTFMTFRGNDTVGNVDSFGIDVQKMVEENSEAFGGSSPAIVSDVAEYFNPTVNDLFNDVSNGDIVTLDLGDKYTELNDKYNVKLTADDLEFTVSGLKELEEIDPFDNMQVFFSEIPNEENSNARICTFTGQYYLSTVDCKIDKELANIGDTVTVEYISKYGDGTTVEQAFAKDGGYKITRSKMEVVVE